MEPHILTCWVSPWTQLGSIYDAIGIAREMASSISSGQQAWTARLLIPTHYGSASQAQVNQSLPPSMLVSSPADVMPMRSLVNSKGLRFGVWGVPLDGSSATVAAAYAAAGGLYVCNFEPGSDFWAPGDDPGAVDAWWGTYWNALPDSQALNGRTFATLVPNANGIAAFQNSLPNLAGGCNALMLETYGGPATASTYVEPNCWPSESFALVEATGVQIPLVPILSRSNLHSQIALASGLGASQCAVWSL